MSAEDGVEDAVAAAYDILRLDDLATPARHVERALGARGALVFAYPDGVAPVVVGGSFGPIMESYEQAHFDGDPLHPAMRALGPRFSAQTGEAWFDREEFERSFAFRDFYRRAGAEDLAGIWLTDGRYGDREMVGILWVGARGFAGPEFAARMEPLRAPLRQAVRRALLFERVERERDVVQVLLARGASRVDLVHDQHARTVWMSPRAQRIFPSGRVPPRLEQHLAAFRSLRGGRIPAGLRSGIGIAPGVIASVFIVRDVPNGPWICATLETVRARAPSEPLTPAESSVLGRMAAGRSNQAIAHELGVAHETVRTHVKRIFRKLEVKNRTEASLRARELGLVAEDE